MESGARTVGGWDDGFVIRVGALLVLGVRMMACGWCCVRLTGL